MKKEANEQKKTNNQTKNQIKQEAINVIKPIFEKYNAIDKDNTMTKEEVFAEIENVNKNLYFKYLKSLSIIQKEKSRFFYNKENEKNIKPKSSVGKRVIISIFIIFVIILIGFFINSKTSNITKISNSDMIFEIGKDWNVFNEYSEDYGWTYFKYISNYPISEENVIEDEINYSMYPATIGIVYENDTTGLYNSIEDLKTVLTTYIESELQPEEYSVDTIETENGYNAISAKIKYTSEIEEINYFYYIYQDDRMAYVSAITYNLDDEVELERTVQNVVNSFKWKK